MTQHISIDLETMGNNPAALILSIGAVKFNRFATEAPTSGEDTFHRIIDVEHPGPAGTLDVSTVMWWMKQPEEARARLFTNPDPELKVPLIQALVEFSEWLGLNDELPEGQEYPDIYLWQRGDKDAQWLTSAYEGCGIKTPFPFWAVGDQRTLCKWVSGPSVVREGVAHDALGDAVYQARCLQQAFRALDNL